MMSSDGLPTLNNAVDAKFRAGGQGLNFFHMTEVVRGDFRVKLYARASDGQGEEVVPESRLAHRLSSVPLIRRNRRWRAWWQARHFDSAVAARLTGANVFLGAGGTCLRSFGAARKLGSRLVLDVTTLHVDQFGGNQDLEGAKFGMRASYGTGG